MFPMIQRRFAPGSRTEALDILRGTALLGVLLVNLVSEFRVPLLAWLSRFHTHSGVLNHAADWIVGVGIESKAYAIFAMLFGVGIAAQASLDRPVSFFIRRFGALVVIGVIHLFFLFSGDILTLYGLLGLVLIPLRNMRPRVLLVASILAMLAHFAVPPLPVPARGVNLNGAIRQAMGVYAHGSFTEIFRYRLTEVRETIFPLLIGSIPRTLGMALFGMATWRLDWMRQPGHHRRLLYTVGPAMFLVGGAGTATEVYAVTTGSNLGHWWAVASTVGIVGLALAYAAGLLLVATTVRGAYILRPIARLGRMTLTNYLGQSVVFGMVFYGYGFGQYGIWGSAPVAALGIVIYAAQVALSNAWLRRHKDGPVEAVWRWISYGAIVPGRIARRP